MQWNDLTKQNKLLVYIFYVVKNCNRYFNIGIDGSNVINNWNITETLPRLRDLQQQLLKKGLICYWYNADDMHCKSIRFTYYGLFRAKELISQLEDNPFEIDFSKHKPQDFDETVDAKIAQLEQENKELRRKLAVDSKTIQGQDPVEKLSLECGKLATKIIQLEKENEELKSKLAEVENQNDDCNHLLETIKDLEHTIGQLQNTIDYRGIIVENLRKSLNAVYSKLDNKTKAYDKIVDVLKKKLAAEQDMVNWTKNIIDGNAI